MTDEDNHEGLFPRNSVGWITLVIIIFIYHFFYYFTLYPKLNQKSIISYIDPSASEQCHYSNEETLDIKLLAPDVLSQYSESKILFTVENNTKSSISYFLIRVVGDNSKIQILDKPQRTERDILQEQTIFHNYIEFYDIPAKGTITGVMWINILDNDEADKKIIYYYTCPDLFQSNENTTAEKYKEVIIKPHKFEALRKSFISAILLPPWANGLLVILSFMMIKLFEDFIPDSKGQNNLRGVGITIFKYLLPILSISLILYALILLIAGPFLENRLWFLAIIVLLITIGIYITNLNKKIKQRRKSEMLEKWKV
jgi:hypothetical protein